MAKGWISLHRQIWHSAVWEDKPFSKGQAWIDLILLANHEDRKALIDNNFVPVQRGSHITSQQKLMKRWGWGKEKVRNFLKLLESDNMITVRTTTRYTLISITNYEVYQNQTDTNPVIPTEKEKEQTNGRPKSDRSQTDGRPNTDRTPTTNNNVNNENNVNKDIYGGRKEIFEHYLSLDLIKHKKYTPAMDMAIKSAMKNNGYTVEDCKKLLDRHKKAVEATKGSEYSIRARPLHEFFGQKAYQAKHLICADYEEGGKYYDLQRPRRKQGPKKQMDFNQFPQHEYTEDELDSLFEKIEMEEVDYG